MYLVPMCSVQATNKIGEPIFEDEEKTSPIFSMSYIILLKSMSEVLDFTKITTQAQKKAVLRLVDKVDTAWKQDQESLSLREDEFNFLVGMVNKPEEYIRRDDGRGNDVYVRMTNNLFAQRTLMHLSETLESMENLEESK